MTDAPERLTPAEVAKLVDWLNWMAEHWPRATATLTMHSIPVDLAEFKPEKEPFDYREQIALPTPHFSMLPGGATTMTFLQLLAAATEYGTQITAKLHPKGVSFGHYRI